MRSIHHLPYRLEIAAGPVAIGPDGSMDELLQFYVDQRLVQPDATNEGRKRDREAEARRFRKRALRDINSVIAVINAAATAEDPAPHRRMLVSRHLARGVMRRYFNSLDCPVEPGSGRDPGQFVQAGDDTLGMAISNAITALSGFFGIMTEAGIYTDSNPTKMDRDKSRLPAGKTKVVTKDDDGGHSVDSDRYFRVRAAGRLAPRSNNPFFLAQVMAAGKAFGWSKAAEVCILAKGRTGGRDFQVRPATWKDFLIDGEGEFIPVPRKGGRRRDRSQRLLVCETLKKALRALADATIKGGWKALMAMTRTNKGRYALARLFIFTIDGGVSPISYSYLNDEQFRPAIERAGLRYLDRGDGTKPGRERYIVMHMLRHEFTNRILDHIHATCADERERMIKQFRLARYMGWKSGEAMLRYYGAWHFNQETQLFIAEAQAAANDNSAPTTLEDVELVAMNDNDRAAVGAIAGGLIRFG